MTSAIRLPVSNTRYEQKLCFKTFNQKKLTVRLLSRFYHVSSFRHTKNKCISKNMYLIKYLFGSDHFLLEFVKLSWAACSCGLLLQILFCGECRHHLSAAVEFLPAA